MANSVHMAVLLGVALFLVASPEAHAASPYSQYKSGVPIDEIRCSGELVLLESPRGTPACVSEASAESLLERGFTAVVQSEDMMKGDDAMMKDDKMMDGDAMMKDDKMMDGDMIKSELAGEIEIGSLLPLSGRLSGHGEENHAGTEFGVIKFNEHLEGIGAGWSFKLVSEDTATNQQIALEKLTALNAKDIKIVIGPETSANTKHVKPYADSNGMLLVSCCSTAPALAIEGDSVYRLVADDSNQGPAMAALIAEEGIEAIVPVWRSDAYGDGLQKTARDAFVEGGGQVDEGIGYNPDTQEFSASVSLLANNVQKYIDELGAEKVGVLYVGFSEIQQIFQSASGYEALSQVRWFGPDGATKQENLITDPIASEFSETVKFTTLQVAAAENPTYTSVQEYVETELGRAPSTFAHSSYDAVWLVGLAMLETGSPDVDGIKSVIHKVAEGYDNAALGSIVLNEAGDLAEADYEVWGTRDGEWKRLGIYTYADGTVTLN